MRLIEPGPTPEVIYAAAANEGCGKANTGEESYAESARQCRACGHEDTSIQLHTQQVAGFGGNAQMIKKYTIA